MSAHDALLANGFQADHVKEMSRVEDLPAYVEGEPEKMASRGWLVGLLIGAIAGVVIGYIVMSLYSTQYLVLTVLISAAAGAALGGYLFALYVVRADEAIDIDVREALGEGKSMLIVETEGAGANRAAGILRRQGSEHVSVYPIPDHEPERV